MDSTRPAPSNLGTLGRTITKILRLRRPYSISGGGGGGVELGLDQDDESHKLKPSKPVEEYTSDQSEPLRYEIGKAEGEQQPEPSCSDREAMESLLANLFTSISAVKAAYAQLQVAQSPYDPETIQSADQVVVSELKHLSELKQSHLKRDTHPPPALSAPPLAAQIQEQRNLLKTYQITTRKLESELQLKDSEVLSLQAELMESDRENRSLEARLYPGRSLSSLDDLHLSGLNPTHFLTALRYAIKSVRTFVKQLLGEMETAGWDLDAAARSIQPDVEPEHRTLAFESFICQRMFSDFQHRNFGVSSLDDRISWSRERFFDEFARLRVKPQFLVVRKGDGLSGLRKFIRSKYLSLVHPKMEASFFGDLDQRGLLSSGRGFPASEFFTGFAEMARRVWLLHCLFFSFGEGAEGKIFQAARGSRFSAVYMESAAEVGAAGSTVGFTVVPGFRVGRTVIQCKVYLLGGTAEGRS